MKHGTLNIILSSIILLSLVGCTNDPQVGEELTIRYGIFLEPCTGYCVREIEIKGDRICYTLYGSDQNVYPDTTIVTALSAQDQKKVHNNIDMQFISTLPDTIGCPVCPENFGEYLEVRQGRFHKKTVIEAEAEVLQLENLLIILREIHGRFH